MSAIDLSSLPCVASSPGIAFTWEQSPEPSHPRLSINFLLHLDKLPPPLSSEFASPNDLKPDMVQVKLVPSSTDSSDSIVVSIKDTTVVDWTLAGHVKNPTTTTSSASVKWTLEHKDAADVPLPIISVELQKAEPGPWEELRAYPLSASVIEEHFFPLKKLDELLAASIPRLPSSSSSSSSDDNVDAKKSGGGDGDDVEEQKKKKMQHEERIKAELDALKKETRSIDEVEADIKARLASVSSSAAEGGAADAENCKKQLQLVEKMRELTEKHRSLRTEPVRIANFIEIVKVMLRKSLIDQGVTLDGEEAEEFTDDAERALPGDDLCNRGVAGLQTSQSAVDVKRGIHFLRLAAIHHHSVQAAMILHSLYGRELRNPTRGFGFVLRRALRDDEEPITNTVITVTRSELSPVMVDTAMDLFFAQRGAKSGNCKALLHLSNVYSALAELATEGASLSELMILRELTKHGAANRAETLWREAYERGSVHAYMAKITTLLSAAMADDSKKFVPTAENIELAKLYLPLVEACNVDFAAKIVAAHDAYLSLSSNAASAAAASHAAKAASNNRHNNATGGGGTNTQTTTKKGPSMPLDEAWGVILAAETTTPSTAAMEKLKMASIAVRRALEEECVTTELQRNYGTTDDESAATSPAMRTATDNAVVLLTLVKAFTAKPFDALSREEYVWRAHALEIALLILQVVATASAEAREHLCSLDADCVFFVNLAKFYANNAGIRDSGINTVLTELCAACLAALFADQQGGGGGGCPRPPVGPHQRTALLKFGSSRAFPTLLRVLITTSPGNSSSTTYLQSMILGVIRSVTTLGPGARAIAEGLDGTPGLTLLMKLIRCCKESRTIANVVHIISQIVVHSEKDARTVTREMKFFFDLLTSVMGRAAAAAAANNDDDESVGSADEMRQMALAVFRLFVNCSVLAKPQLLVAAEVLHLKQVLAAEQHFGEAYGYQLLLILNGEKVEINVDTDETLPGRLFSMKNVLVATAVSATAAAIGVVLWKRFVSKKE